MPCRSLIIGLSAGFLSALIQVDAVDCFYPDGHIAYDGVPCSTEGGQCCPLNWLCLSNGLCYYPPDDYFGRYSCTDQTWQSSRCPAICTHENTAVGNEAILKCGNDWCCDGDRVSGDCCDMADTDFFALPEYSTYASISTTFLPTSAPSVSNPPPSTTEGVPVTLDPGRKTSSYQTFSSSSTADTTLSSSTTTQQQSTTSSPTTTPTSAKISTGENGIISTEIIISTATANPTAISKPPIQHHRHHSPTSTGAIIGLALGVPLALAAASLAATTLVQAHRRRRQRRAHAFAPSPASPPLQANYPDLAPGSHAAELDGRPVAPTRSPSGRKSELYGSPPTSLSMASPSFRPDTRGLRAAMGQEEPLELWAGQVERGPGGRE